MLPLSRESSSAARSRLPASPAAQETTKAPHLQGSASTATGIRTPVSAVRGRRPSPLDDGGLERVRLPMGRQTVARLQRSVTRLPLSIDW